jgi:tetratricopeptide (TPR) repeat protein
MHSLLLLAVLASVTFAPLDEPTPALQARILRELDRPQAIPDLFRLYERRDEKGDLSALVATLDRAAKSPKARPDVRALALEIRAELAVSMGQLPQATAFLERVAPLRAWSFIGPFDNEGRSGLLAEYPPEKEGYDPKAVYRGKEHDVTWRTLPALPSPHGFVDLAAAVYPRTDVAVYAATVIRSGKQQAAIFHIGASGATRVWLNGRLVHEDAALHPSRFDQRSFAGELQAGDNFLLVKIAHSTGRLGFSLRLADGKDAPLVELAKAARVPDAPAKAFAAAPSQEGGRKHTAAAGHKPLDAVDELKAAAAKNPSDARAQEDLAVILHWRRPSDEGERMPLHAMERAADAAPTDPEVALRLARLQDRDANKRRAALDAALAAHPADAALLDALAGYRLDRGEGWTALELAHRARAAAPNLADPMITEARALDAVGLSARASLVRLEVARAHPDLSRAHRAAAGALRRLGRAAEAAEELKKALALRFDDGEARSELVALALDRGDLDAALKLLGELVSLEPASLYPRLRAAELLSENGRAQQADEAFAQAVALSPDDPEPHEQLGRHRLRRQDDSGALAAFARALSLRPQNPGLRELVRAVRPEEQYAAPYLYDARVLAMMPPLPGEDVEVLADLSVTKVFANGLSSRTRQVVLRALSPRGVDAARTQSVQYSPDRQQVKVERARIFRKDGSLLESKSEGERNLSEPWYGLYYDVRARIIGFPQLEAGDVVELVTRIDDSGSNFFADYFGDFAYLQSTQSRRISDYVLLGPAGRTFYANATPLRGLTHTEGQSQDGGTWQRWTARDVAKLVPEPSMPGYSEVLAYVHVSTYKTWDDVGRFYWGLVKDQLRVTGEIRAAAAEAVKGIPESDDQARIRAVYDFVVSRTRYVGLEFGINSFKPYPVETILSRRFGDCKDKASLMHAMLEALGIDSRLTLLRMKRLGGIESAPASLAVFNHAILYVPKYQLFLDGTAEFHGSGELPADDRGAEVLVVEPGGGSKFFRTPEALPQDNTDETRISARLAADGTAAVEVNASLRGSWTAELRRTFEAADGRRAKAEEQLAHSVFPNVKVTAIDVSDPHDIEKPFLTQIVATATGFALASGGGLKFSPFGQRQSFVESYAQLSRRLLPQRLPAPQKTVIESRVELPAGWTVTLPEGARESGPQGSYQVTYAGDGAQVTARLEFTMNGGLLQPKEYGAFRAFLGRLDEALHRRVEAMPAARTASAQDLD